MFHGSDFLNRSLISAVGALSNGGIVAAFGAFYYPYLPELGGYITSLCAIGTVMVALGFAAAAISHNVRTLVQLRRHRILTDLQLATIIGCQGVLVGFGAGILIHVLWPILPEYFPQRGGLAQGVMFACKSLARTLLEAC